jgi:riboflavin biosynthesis pyrimidine reductase
VSLQLLWEQGGLPQGDLPPALRQRYDGGLGFDGPCVYANFVQTLDGVVAIPDVERSNVVVADGSDDDRFVMGLLRAFADVVLIGTGTLLSSPKGRWRPEGVFPAGKEAFAEMRARLGKEEQPAVAIVTSGASLDLSHPVVAAGALVVTTERGAVGLAADVPNLAAVGRGEWVPLPAAVELLHARGYEHVLSEAGPTTFTELLAAGLVDELFLTVSPVLAGRLEAHRRLSLVEGVELLPERRVAPSLRSIRRGGDHLFLRYKVSGSREAGA